MYLISFSFFFFKKTVADQYPTEYQDISQEG